MRPLGLATRIFAGTVALLISSVFAVLLATRATSGDPMAPLIGAHARLLAERVAERSTIAAQRAELERFAHDLAFDCVVYDAHDRVIGQHGDSASLTPPSRAEREALRAHRSVTRSELPPLHLGAAPSGIVAVLRPARDGAPLGTVLRSAAVVLLCAALASWLFARTLAQPLRRVVQAARAFGAGKLDARTGLRRSDEIGEVAVAFDEMAARVQAHVVAQRELLANVSHELRTPLSRLRVALDLAAEGDASDYRMSMGEMAEDLGELERLVEDVLTTSRLTSGTSSTLPLRLERCAPDLLCERAAERFRAVHPERALELELESDLPPVQVDPALFRRAIDNLLDNARKYSDDDRPICLRLERDGDSIVVEVRDEGIGLDPADLAQVFQPFFRADRSRNRGTGGLGLGLTLTKRILEAHGGSVALESEVGRGTRVALRLPVD